MERRIGEQTQKTAQTRNWKPALAAAALIILAALIATPFLINPFVSDIQTTDVRGEELSHTETAAETKTADAASQNRVFTLRHRLPSEVLPQLRRFMSDDAELHVLQDENKLDITDRPENIERLSRALAMLDTPPATMLLKLRFFYANAADSETAEFAEARREVSELDEIDLSKYRLDNEMELTLIEGRRISATLQDRYVINCFATIDLEGKKILLRDISIFDQETQQIVRKSGISVSEGKNLVIQTGQLDDSGQPLVIAIAFNPEE